MYRHTPETKINFTYIIIYLNRLPVKVPTLYLPLKDGGNDFHVEDIWLRRCACAVWAGLVFQASRLRALSFTSVASCCLSGIWTMIDNNGDASNLS